MRQTSIPPNGPISIQVAVECLTIVMNVNPLEDLAVFAWASERQAIMAAQRSESQTHADWLRRFGTVNPEALAPMIIGKPIPPTYIEPVRNGRPHETRMDAANALLLRAHRMLHNTPLHFAMLESLYGLDSLETLRFPSPKTWREHPELAIKQRNAVRVRACQRIRRALEVNAEPMVEGASNLVGVDYSSSKSSSS